jgi:AraC family transcriptional regulator of adaptative response / DNA-3-methyladenine glycosylase II
LSGVVTASENGETSAPDGCKVSAMELDFESCYRAIATRDARFDGRFFTGVRTTGIYCRPICPARTPRRENVTFYPTAAAAQEAGFRPCLRCRPETSPARGAWHGTSNTVSRALMLIEDGALDEGSVADLAARLGVGERQLRRLFRRHLGASPVAVAQTRRVHLARQLIAETDLAMTEVALAAGYGSLRRFNDTFHRLYGRPPSALRRRRGAEIAQPGSAMTLRLAYRPPYDWDAMLGFLGVRAIPGVERVAGDAYTRTIALDGAFGTVSVTPDPRASCLVAAVRFPRVTALPEILARLRRVFDLAADPLAIAAQLGEDPAMAPLVAARPGLRVPGAWDGFELAVRAILGQQITVAGATRLAGKLAAAYGTQLAPDLASPGLTHAFPRPERIARADLATLGMPGARARALSAMAAACAADPLLFATGESLEAGIGRLVALPGIGKWTASYIAMRALREPDAFPDADIGLMRALADANGARPNAAELRARAEAWRPWRAYAALHLWMADARPQPVPAPSRENRRDAHDRPAGDADRHAPSRL